MQEAVYAAHRELFLNGRSQAVRLPADLRFEGREVFIRQDETTGDVILSRRPESWDNFFKLRREASVPMNSWPTARMKRRRSVSCSDWADRDDPFLLGTNIASCIIKGNSPAVDRRLVKVAMADLAISTVTEGELRFGAARLPQATRLHNMIEDFLLRVAILPWDSDAAQQCGQLRASLEREGQSMGTSMS